MKTSALLLFSAILLYPACSSTVPDKTVKPSYQQFNTYRWVTAESGLFIRENHNQGSAKIVLIPLNSKVHCIKKVSGAETIDGRSGHWTYVEWKDKKGWVFGGFLTDEKPVILTPALIALQKAALALYSTKNETKKYYKNTVYRDIKITQTLGNYAIVIYSKDVLAADNKSDVGALWVFAGGRWSEYATGEMGFGATLLYLNNDKYPDYISEEGCCSTTNLKVALGIADGGFTEVFNAYEAGHDTEILSSGRCGETVIIIRNNMNVTSKKYFFNCRTNSMEQIIEKSK